jgi:hypothetical protein
MSKRKKTNDPENQCGITESLQSHEEHQVQATEVSSSINVRQVNRKTGQPPRRDAHRGTTHRAFREMDDTPAMHPFQDVTSLNNIDCGWEPSDTPLSNNTLPKGMCPTVIREYFSSMTSVYQETMCVGDFVELIPGPGATRTRIAQVQALWRQTNRPIGNCLHGRFLRYYRFEETSLTRLGLKSADNNNTVYKTSHFEENLPLAAVLNTCRVQARSVDSAECQETLDKDTLVCSATYDIETGALGPIGGWMQDWEADDCCNPGQSGRCIRL